jgi:hypothetical protein
MLKFNTFFGVTVCSLLVTTASAQTTKLRPNTLSCAGFTKNPDGSWHAGSNTQPFDIGSQKHEWIHDADITPNLVKFDDVDLYSLLEAKCGKH